MPTASVGRLVVTGSDEEIALVRRAVERCTLDLDRYLADDVRVSFGETPLVPGTNVQSYAFAWSGERRIRIRADQVAKPARAQYLILHELGHVIDNDHLSRTKRDQLRALMDPAPSSWGDAPTYYHSPAECFADTLAVAFSDLRSPLARIYKRHIADHGAFRKIVRHPGLLHFMPEIKRIESSGRQYAQNASSGASGFYGFMPRNWRITASKVLEQDPALARTHVDEQVPVVDPVTGEPVLDEAGQPVTETVTRLLPPEEWLPEMSVANQEKVARSEMNRLARRFDEDWRKVAVSWRNGEGWLADNPIDTWPTDPQYRGETKYVNDACVPLGYDPLPLPSQPEEPIVRLLIGAQPGQVGRIAKGTALLHPDTLAPVTTLAIDAPEAPLVGESEDGKFRGVLAVTSRLPGSNRKLLLVDAAKVSDIRVPELPVSEFDAMRAELARLGEETQALRAITEGEQARVAAAVTAALDAQADAVVAAVGRG